MSMEPINMEKVRLIADHYGLKAIRIKGTSQVQICKKMDERKYQVISWEDFEKALDDRNLSVYKDNSSCFLKIMKKDRS